MHDPRKPRPLKPCAVAVMVVDANSFSRNLIGEILRSLDVTNVTGVRNKEAAETCLTESTIDVVLVSWEDGDALDGLGFVRQLRSNPNDRLRRLPAVLVTSSLTRQMVINGRDAGIDEFLARPISPAALRQRLEMVVETPRPFIDCSAYLGPCRRRKNPADYHGAKRRTGECAAPVPMVDADEEAAKTPIRLALASLRGACMRVRAGERQALADFALHMKSASDIALVASDHALLSALMAFEAYISVAAPLGQVEENVTTIALSALEQLAALPQGYADARNSVALALGKAIQKKLAA